MAPNYKRLMPDFGPLQNVIESFTDLSLPNRQLQRIGSRAEEEARTMVRPQQTELENLRRSLQQQRSASLNRLETERGRLPQSFNQQIQQAISGAQRQQQQRGAVSGSGQFIQDMLTGGAQVQQQNAQNLAQLTSQQSQVEQNYLGSLLSDVFAPQRELAAQQGSEAAKRYSQYINAAQQEVMQGRLDEAEQLLAEAQREYTAAVQQAQNEFAQWYNKQQSSARVQTSGANAPGSYQQHLAQAIKMAGIPQDQIPYFNWIIERESSFNPRAKNPNSTAYGYGQFLKSTRRNYERKTGLNYDNPVHQLVMAYQYMVDRYGSPKGAVEFWKKNNWY